MSIIQTGFGPVAHLVERLICTEEVAGSSPVGSTKLKTARFNLAVFNFVDPKKALGELSSGLENLLRLFCELVETKYPKGVLIL
mgnify:CR=1 FL=1